MLESFIRAWVSPIVDSENVWGIYRELLHQFENLDDAVDFIEECQVYLDILDEQVDIENAVPPAGVELYRGLEEPDTDGTYYMGGVNNGRGLGKLTFGSKESKLNQPLIYFVRYSYGK
jgi:hypothetical protein